MWRASRTWTIACSAFFPTLFPALLEAFLPAFLSALGAEMRDVGVCRGGHECPPYRQSVSVGEPGLGELD
jgi:hypothetical protein